MYSYFVEMDIDFADGDKMRANNIFTSDVLLRDQDMFTAFKKSVIEFITYETDRDVADIYINNLNLIAVNGIQEVKE